MDTAEIVTFVVGGLVLIALSEAVRRRRQFLFGDAARGRWRWFMLIGGAAMILRAVFALL